MDEVTRIVLESFGVSSFAELWELPMADVVGRVDEVSAHGADKALAVLVLKGVVELRGVTADVANAAESTHETTRSLVRVAADVARAAESTDKKTKNLVLVAKLTLAVAVVTLLATIVIAVTAS